MKNYFHPHELKEMFKNKLDGYKRFGKSDSKALSEIRARIGLTKQQIYNFLGWTDPAIVFNGSPTDIVIKHRKNYISHPWDEILKLI